jgi:hypothetical protein
MGWFSRKDDNDASPRIGFVWSTNMLLRVAAPADAGWQRIEAHPKPPLLAAIKCVRGAPPDAIALDAYVYDDAPPFADLAARDWRAHYLAEMFASIASLDVDPIEHATRSGFSDKALAIRVDGRLRAPDMAIRLMSRHVVSDGKLLVASAVASAVQHDAHDKLIHSWLSHASLGG